MIKIKKYKLIRTKMNKKTYRNQNEKNKKKSTNLQKNK